MKGVSYITSNLKHTVAEGCDEINDPRVYSISARSFIKLLIELGLVDGGVNGGIFKCKEICFIFYHLDSKHVNISGVGKHLINHRFLATFYAVINTHLGRFLGIFHNYTYVTEQQSTISFCFQLMDSRNLFCDTATQLGGMHKLIVRMATISQFAFAKNFITPIIAP